MSCFNAWDIGACGCGPSACNVGFGVQGLSSQWISGASVSVYTDSSLATLIGTCTTDGTGKCTIDVGSTGTYWEVVTAPNFNTWSGSSSVGSCNVNLSPVNIGATNQNGGTGGGPKAGYGLTPCDSQPITIGSIAFTFTTTSSGQSANLAGTMVSYSPPSGLLTGGSYGSACVGPGPFSTYYKLQADLYTGLWQMTIYSDAGCVTAQSTNGLTNGHTCGPFHMACGAITLWGNFNITSLLITGP